jgi:hypothetical protein
MYLGTTTEVTVLRVQNGIGDDAQEAPGCAAKGVGSGASYGR